jgi:hypothetical protein
MGMDFDDSLAETLELTAWPNVAHVRARRS